MIYEPPAKCQAFTKDVKNALDTIDESSKGFARREAPRPPESSKDLEKKNRRVSLGVKVVKKGAAASRLRTSLTKMQATAKVLDLHAHHREERPEHAHESPTRKSRKAVKIKD